MFKCPVQDQAMSLNDIKGKKEDHKLVCIKNLPGNIPCWPHSKQNKESITNHISVLWATRHTAMVDSY